MEFNVYCDESCHLEHDQSNAMVIGSVWCPKERKQDISNRIKEIKIRNSFNVNSEAKWTKICPKWEAFYRDLINYFFDTKDMHFRCVVIPDKHLLNHERFNQTHEDWYYKMYFTMLKHVFNINDVFNVYIDIKDTNSYNKSQILHDVCCHSMYDFSSNIIKKIQPIRSHEVEIMQIVDILVGAITYMNRDFPEDQTLSIAKQNIINLIRRRSGYTLKKSTLIKEDKLNIFIWNAESRGM